MKKDIGRINTSAAIKVAYEKKLMRLINDMHKSVKWFLTARYRENEDVIIATDSATNDIEDELKKLFKGWSKKFDDAAVDISVWFISQEIRHAKAGFKEVLKKAGFTVNTKLTRAQQDKLKAVMVENVRLIKSIPEKYFTDLTSITMESISRGRDLKYMTEELQRQYGVTKDRAITIARDQNNKATSVITHLEYEDFGITKARWKHNSGAKHPRATHVAANNKEYDIKKGLWIDGKYIFPGSEINCGCTSEPIIEGINDEREDSIR